MISETLYADYVAERENMRFLEREDCFCQYKVRDGELYIAHMFVKPEARKSGVGSFLIHSLKGIAKHEGCRALTAIVDLSVGDPENTLLGALKVGFKINQAMNNVLLIKIDLPEGGE